MAKPETFWTPKRLIELRVMARAHTNEQLAEHFGRSTDDIEQARKYDHNKRRLYLETKAELIGKKRVMVTYFKAEWAEDARFPQEVGSYPALF